jgi:DnaJ-class molecular chaperone
MYPDTQDSVYGFYLPINLVNTKDMILNGVSTHFQVLDFDLGNGGDLQINYEGLSICIGVWEGQSYWKVTVSKDIVSNLEISLEEGLLGAEKKIAIKGLKGGIKTFTVNVPTGIHDGEKIRLAALGHPGKNGGKNGDLIINVHISKHIFT